MGFLLPFHNVLVNSLNPYLYIIVGYKAQYHHPEYWKQIDDESRYGTDVGKGHVDGAQDHQEDGAGGQDTGYHQEHLVGDVQLGNVLVFPGYILPILNKNKRITIFSNSKVRKTHLRFI